MKPSSSWQVNRELKPTSVHPRWREVFFLLASQPRIETDQVYFRVDVKSSCLLEDNLARRVFLFLVLARASDFKRGVWKRVFSRHFVDVKHAILGVFPAITVSGIQRGGFLSLG
jgi:hypothetical protein